MYVDFAAEKTSIYGQVCGQSCFAIAGGLEGDRWVLLDERMHLSFEKLVR